MISTRLYYYSIFKYKHSCRAFFYFPILFSSWSPSTHRIFFSLPRADHFGFFSSKVLFALVVIAVTYLVISELAKIVFTPEFEIIDEYTTQVSFASIGERLERVFTYLTVYLLQAQPHIPLHLKIAAALLVFVVTVHLLRKFGLVNGLLAFFVLFSILFLSFGVGLLRDFEETFRYTGLAALMFFLPAVLALGVFG